MSSKACVEKVESDFIIELQQELRAEEKQRELLAKELEKKQSSEKPEAK